MNDFGRALQTASPFLLGLGAQLQGRDPDGISSGLAQMQEEAEKARRKSAIADLMGQMGIGGSKAALLDMLPFEAQAQMLMQEQQRMEGDAAFNDLYGALYGGGGGYGDISAPNMGGVASGPLNPTPSDANYVAPEDLQPVFSAAEQQYGLPAGYLARTAKIESGFNPNAKNPNSSATGLFQFIGSTAKRYGLANPTDPMASTEAAARLAADNAAVLRRALGREPTSAELYLAHQQGAGGAARLLSNPDARAADIVGADAVRLNGGSLDMTAGQFANKWLRKFGQPKQKDDNVTRRALLQAIRSADPGVQKFAQMEYEKRFGQPEFDASRYKVVGDTLVDLMAPGGPAAAFQGKSSPLVQFGGGAGGAPIPPQSAVPEGVDVSGALGSEGLISGVANTVADMFGADLPAPQNEQAIQVLNNLRVRTMTTLQQAIPGRPSNYLMQQLEKLAVEPQSLLMGEGRARERLQQTQDMIRQELGRMETLLQNPAGLSNTEISNMVNGYTQLKALNEDYQRVLDGMGRGQNDAAPDVPPPPANLPQEILDLWPHFTPEERALWN